MKFEKGESSKIRKRQKKKKRGSSSKKEVITEIPLYTIDTLYLFN